MAGKTAHRGPRWVWLIGFLVVSVMQLSCTGAPVHSGEDGCVRDLEYIPGFLLENDTGARDHLARKGEPALEQALKDASAQAEETANDEECGKILAGYLRAWRPGHLLVAPMPNALEASAASDGERQVDAGKPTLKWLSAQTVLLTAPTFNLGQQAAMKGVLEGNRQRLSRTPNWIIDIRRNNGGADLTYMPLLDAITVNARYDIGAEFLSTPSNIANSERVCAVVAPDSKECLEALAPMVAAMRAVPTGQYGRLEGMDRATTGHPPMRAARNAPRRVAIMIDRACGSSCEEFLLAARQSYNVKLFGRRTYGALDYSNLRPQSLPSGRRMLWYATSRSLRLPHLPVDAAGIPPDIFLPAPEDEKGFADEILAVQRIMEGS